MTPDMIEQVLHAKKKGQQGLVFKIKQGQVVEKVAADESTIVDAGDNTTGVNDPPSPKWPKQQQQQWYKFRRSV